MSNDSENSRVANKAITVICLVVLAVCLTGIGILLYSNHKTKMEYEELKEKVLSEADSNEAVAAEIDEPEETLEADEPTTEDEMSLEEEDIGPWYEAYARTPDKEVDFDELKAINPDVYAWITIDGTAIDYPIAHCDEETAFYLDHDIDGKPSKAGMIFTDTCNSNDFSDPMTLIYGHNMKNGSMFKGLHSFRDASFFKEHDTVKIYMDGIELDYRIYDCFISPNEHILKVHDFSNPIGCFKYIDGLKNKRDFSANFRDDIELEVSDHMLTLITCVGDPSRRLFVQCVLTYPDGTTENDHLDESLNEEEP